MKQSYAEVYSTLESGHFNAEINRLRICFGDTRFDESRVKRIWKFTKNLANDELTHIVDEMIDSFRQVPIPDDFKRMSARFKRYADVPDVPLVPDCSRCGDIGFIKVWYHDDVHSNTLMRCTCERSFRHSDLCIPHWDPSIASVFAWSKIPDESFGPKLKSDSEIKYQDVVKSIWIWKAQLKVADEHWTVLSTAKSKVAR